MKPLFRYIIPSAVMVLGLGLASCSSDLDIEPSDPNTKYSTDIKSDQLLNKCYGNFAVEGQNGGGSADFSSSDAGTTGYVRQVFNCENLTTDEAICAWSSDPGISEWNASMPTSNNAMLTMLYNRQYMGIDYCNAYIAQYGNVDATKTAEARFLRAYEYYILLDVFGDPAFSTAISAEAPKQIDRVSLYNWIMSELKDIEPTLNDPAPKQEGQEGYGRVDKAADWLLQARMYLNSQVYTGVARWDSAKVMAQKVMNSPYKLYTGATKNGWTAYQQLFMGDNGTNGSSVEAIFPIVLDGQRSQEYGCTNFLILGSTNGSEYVNPDGASKGSNISGGWSGNRARPELIEKFFSDPSQADGLHAYQMPTAAGDDRALFEADGRTLENTGMWEFTNGFTVCKWNNWYTTGNQAGHNSDFPDTDYFLMRAAEAYLIDAEADARLNGGRTTAEGTAAINALRDRAHNAVKAAAYSLDDICDEWSREFYWEGLRRPTLIRFGKFAGASDYTWSWKGGVISGRSTDSHYNLFPLPSDELTSNSNLQQNPGYAK